MMKAFRALGVVLLALQFGAGMGFSQTFTAGKWSRIKNNPPTGVGHAMLLTDGSVLVINSGCAATGNWYRLVPDSTGSYANGTWSAAGNLPNGYNPLYFASQVLPSGAVVVMGGEYNACNGVWTNLGAIYHPATNKWVAQAAPAGWTSVGDAQSIILPNGKMMLANCCTTDEAILTVAAAGNTWAATGANKKDWNDEEGWTMLPGTAGQILTVDTYVNGGCCQMGYQIYTPSTGKWTTPSNTTVVNLVDPSSAELGPAALLPNGTVFAVGATTNNAIYNIATKTWKSAPKFGGTLDSADGAAAVLPDGNLLIDTSPGVFGTGVKFFEWDGKALHAVSGPPNAALDSSYYGHMVVLPTGQILFTDFSSAVELYTPAGTACTGCEPTVTTVATTLTHGSKNNPIKGTQFNGVTQGAYYGDDDQSFSNFPLVRLTDSAGTVFYCNTHNWLGGVAQGATKITAAQFDVPATAATGAATLEVVTNGIPSAAVSVTID